jgi:hypothetical protein
MDTRAGKAQALLNMGFGEADANAALDASGGDVSAAAMTLLS